MSFFSSFTLVVLFYYYYLPKKGTHSSCSTRSLQSRNQRLSIMSFLSLFPLDLCLLLLLMTLCFGSTAVVCGQCFPTCPRLREWDVSHTLSLSPVVLCLRYHQYQHHRRGHRRLHSLPRTHPGCYSLVLQVSHCATSLWESVIRLHQLWPNKDRLSVFILVDLWLSEIMWNEKRHFHTTVGTTAPPSGMYSS